MRLDSEALEAATRAAQSAYNKCGFVGVAARDAVAAYLTHRHQQGHVEAPIKPTERMIDEGLLALPGPHATWDVMIRAASPAAAKESE